MLTVQPPEARENRLDGRLLLSICCVVELSLVLCAKPYGEIPLSFHLRHSKSLILGGMTNLIIAATATSFFWQTLEYPTAECPSQLIVVCVKLSYDSLGLAVPGLDVLKSLHECISRAAFEKMTLLGVVEPTPPAKPFLDRLANMEIAILENFDFDCVVDNSFQYLRVGNGENESLTTFYKLHASLFCLNLSKSAWRFNPPNLASVVSDIYNIVFKKYALIKDPNNSKVPVGILNDLLVVFAICNI